MKPCTCHACTCSGCHVCDPPEPSYNAADQIPPTPPELQIDPWATPVGGAA